MHGRVRQNSLSAVETVKVRVHVQELLYLLRFDVKRWF